MLSPVIQTVLQMGFEAGLVESLVQTKYLLNGQHYTSVSGLVTDILAAEEEDRTRRPQSRGQSKNGDYINDNGLDLHRTFLMFKALNTVRGGDSLHPLPE
jgi:hypothetical protein